MNCPLNTQGVCQPIAFDHSHNTQYIQQQITFLLSLTVNESHMYLQINKFHLTIETKELITVEPGCQVQAGCQVWTGCEALACLLSKSLIRRCTLHNFSL